MRKSHITISETAGRNEDEQRIKVDPCKTLSEKSPIEKKDCATANVILPTSHPDNVYSLTIFCGCFRNLEDDTKKKKSRQWGALLDRDPNAIGGFHRIFLKRALNGFLELNDQLKPGCYMELSDGSDKSKGYYRILGRDKTTFTIEEVTKNRVMADDKMTSVEASHDCQNTSWIKTE